MTWRFNIQKLDLQTSSCPKVSCGKNMGSSAFPMTAPSSNSANRHHLVFPKHSQTVGPEHMETSDGHQMHFHINAFISACCSSVVLDTDLHWQLLLLPGEVCPVCKCDNLKPRKGSSTMYQKRRHGKVDLLQTPCSGQMLCCLKELFFQSCLERGQSVTSSKAPWQDRPPDCLNLEHFVPLLPSCQKQNLAKEVTRRPNTANSAFGAVVTFLSHWYAKLNGLPIMCTGPKHSSCRDTAEMRSPTTPDRSILETCLSGLHMVKSVWREQPRLIVAAKSPSYHSSEPVILRPQSAPNVWLPALRLSEREPSAAAFESLENSGTRSL